MSIVDEYIIQKFNLSIGFALSQIKISSFSIINLLFVLKPYTNIKINVLKYIGDNSYGIYYIHMLWVLITNKIYSNVTLKKDILPIYQVIQLISVVIMSLIGIRITKKIIGERLANRY